MLVSVTGYIVPVCIIQVLLLVSVWTCGFNLFLKCVIRQELMREYAFLEFVTPSCKWGKVVCLQNVCKFYKFGPLVWDTTCNLISHVCLFLITRPLVHHKNKINSLETRLWKDTFLYGKTLTAKFKGLTVKVGFQTNIFYFFNQPEVWWWE